MARITPHPGVLVTERMRLPTPYNPDAWQRELGHDGLLHLFPSLVYDIRFGAPIGSPPPLSATFIPKNSKSATIYANIIDDYLTDEIAAGRMYGGLSVDDAHIFFGGHFRTAPMAVVIDGVKARVVHNFSAEDETGTSTNSWLDAHEAPIMWHSAALMADMVSSARPGTQACALDWVKAYRASPIKPDHKRYIASMWRGLIFPNHAAPFGLTTSGNIQGVVADALIHIFRYHHIPRALKWVDDFNIQREPISQTLLPDGRVEYQYGFDMDTVRNITDPLGIQWHPFTKKGHDFDYQTEYTGFSWDLQQKRVALPEAKRTRYLRKVTDFLAGNSGVVREKETVSLHGTLQHVCFVYRHGGVLMPSISRFASSFPHRFAQHHIPSGVRSDLQEWQRLLAQPNFYRSLLPRGRIDLDVWVDASDWGIGLVVGDRWAAWRLRVGWHANGRDIGWAEMVALELAVTWFVALGHSDDVDFIVNGDNTGVIDAVRRGRSRNVPRNDSIRRMLDLLIPHNIIVSPSYVPSAANRADPISRGNLGPNANRLPATFDLPEDLIPYIDPCFT